MNTVPLCINLSEIGASPRASEVRAQPRGHPGARGLLLRGQHRARGRGGRGGARGRGAGRAGADGPCTGAGRARGVLEGWYWKELQHPPLLSAYDSLMVTI